jgi:hypothetical protein
MLLVILFALSKKKSYCYMTQHQTTRTVQGIQRNRRKEHKEIGTAKHLAS